jgi:uncharacterized protein (TIGR04255 family)
LILEAAALEDLGEMVKARAATRAFELSHHPGIYSLWKATLRRALGAYLCTYSTHSCRKIVRGRASPAAEAEGFEPPRGEVCPYRVRSSAPSATWLRLLLQNVITSSPSPLPSWPHGKYIGKVIETPFGPPVQEVPLRHAPLVSVIAQVRFPPVMSIQADPGFVAPFQEALRSDYPIMRQERQLQVLIGPTGGLPQDAGVILRFEQQDLDSWQVTLAPTFVSLSAKCYSRRSDFLARLTVILHSLESWLGPKVCDRIGVRYVDRLHGEQLTQLSKLIRPEVLGMGGVAPNEGVEVVHTLADALFRLDDTSELRSRWGLLPARATYDPGIEPVNETSWVLDLDHYTAGQEDFDLATITNKAATFCDRIYRFFRWSVTDDFLDTFGAER